MYTIKQASARSGVGIPLLRAWERRYGVVNPARTPAGYRLYDELAIQRLTAMRRLVEAGWSPREAAPRVLAEGPDGLRDLLPPGSRSEPAGEIRGVEAERLAAAILEAAKDMRQEQLEAALDAAFSSTRFEMAMEQVIFPALSAIGAAWAGGELDVGAEHAASAAILRRLGTAYQAAGSESVGTLVVVGLPPSSRHELAALAVATAARRAGLRVMYLGPDVPIASWLASVRDTGASAVAVGAVMPDDAEAVGAVFASLSEHEPKVLRTVGGRYADAVSGEGHLVLPPRLSDAVGALRHALSAA